MKKNKTQKEFIIVGDNNFWYAQGYTKPDLKQARMSLKLTAKSIKKGGTVFADDEYLPEASLLYLYVVEEIDRVLV